SRSSDIATRPPRLTEHRRPLLSALDRALAHPSLKPLARPCALLLVARLGRAEVKTTRRLPARHGENEASAKARVARVHFASSTSPTQSILTDTCRCSAS